VLFPQGLITAALLERLGRLGERAEAREPQP
jgi:hypothetical protein